MKIVIDTRSINLFIFFLLLVGCKVADTRNTENKSESQSLFDGVSLDGWEGNLDFFRIKEGAIVAGSFDKEIPQNEFLCTKTTYENFELSLEAKMHVDNKGHNAGIQFRSERIPNHHEVIGYQCDMGGKIWAKLYDESRRKEFLYDTNIEEMMRVLKPHDWNEIVIRAEGSRIQIWLNGYQTVDFTENNLGIDKSGLICLQIHSGPVAEAWYKNLQIVEL